MANLPLVKISWIDHNRQYEFPIELLLKELPVEISDDEIMVAVRKLLSTK